MDLLGNILGGLTGQQGESYTYNLTTSKGKALIGIDNTNHALNWTPDSIFPDHQVTVSIDNNSLATITFPDYNWKQIQIKNLTMSGLTISTDENQVSYLEMGDNARITGVFTYDNVDYTADAANFTIALTQKDIAATGIINFSEKEDSKEYQQLQFEFEGIVVPKTVE